MDRYTDEAFAYFAKRQGEVQNHGGMGEGGKGRPWGPRQGGPTEFVSQKARQSAASQEFGALVRPRKPEGGGARNSAVSTVKSALDPKALHKALELRHSAATRGGRGRPAPRLAARAETARTYAGLYRAQQRPGSSASSRASVGASSGGPRGSAATKDLLLQKVKTMYDQRLSLHSRSAANLGSGGPNSGSQQDPVHERLARKYGPGPSHGDGGADHREHHAKVINVKLSSHVAGSGQADHIEFQPLRKPPPGAAIPQKSKQRREALPIRLADLENGPSLRQKKRPEQQAPPQRFKGRSVEENHEARAPPNHSTSGRHRPKLGRSISSRASSGLSGASEDSEDMEDSDAEPHQTFEQQFLHPQLGAFRSHRLLQQRSQAAATSAHLEAAQAPRGGRMTQGANEPASAGMQSFDKGHRRPKAARRKPRGGAAAISQRNSLSGVQDQQEWQQSSASRTQEEPSRVEAEDYVEEGSDGQHSAVSFANSRAFAASRSGTGSRAGSFSQTDDGASSVSFAATKRRRGRPERCRRRGSGARLGSASAEQLHSLLQQADSDTTESEQDSVPQENEPALAAQAEELAPPEATETSPAFRIKVTKLDPKKAEQLFDQRLCDDMGVEDEASQGLQISPTPHAKELITTPIASSRINGLQCTSPEDGEEGSGRAREPHRPLLQTILAHAQDRLSYRAWLDAIKEEVHWLKQEDEALLAEFKNSSELLKDIDFGPLLQVCKDNNEQLKGEKSRKVGHHRIDAKEQAVENEENELGEDYAAVLYFCALILKYHGDGLATELGGADPAGEDQTKKAEGSRGAAIGLEQLSLDRDIQDDVVRVAKSVGVLVQVPVDDVAAAPQDFSFTAEPQAEALEQRNETREELAFVLADAEIQANDLGKLNEPGDPAEHNMFLLNSLSRIEAGEESEGDLNPDASSQSFDLVAEVESHGPPAEKDAQAQASTAEAADNSAIFNYLEKQYSPGGEEVGPPGLASLGQRNLNSRIAETETLKLSLKEKIAKKKLALKQTDWAHSEAWPLQVEDGGPRCESDSYHSMVNEFDQADLDGLEIVNNSTIKNDLEVVVSQKVPKNPEDGEAERRTEWLQELLPVLNRKLLRIEPRQTCSQNKLKELQRSDFSEFLRGRPKSASSRPEGGSPAIPVDFFGLNDHKMRQIVDKLINQAFLERFLEVGRYRLNGHNRHHFPLGRQAKTEPDESTDSARISLHDVSALEKANINDQWYQYIYDDNSPLGQIGLGLDEHPQNQSLLHRTHVSDGASDASQLSEFSRFTLHSDLSHFQSIQDQRRTIYERLSKKFPMRYSSSPLSLQMTLDTISTTKIARSLSLVQPILSIPSLKQNLFHLPAYGSPQLREAALNDVQLAKYLYLKDLLPKCMGHCNKLRLQYLQKRQSGNRKDKQQLTSHEIAVIYLILLQCTLELMLQKKEDEEQGHETRRRLTSEAHGLLDEVPIVVKNRQQEAFTVLEVLLGYKEQRALAKLKDIDYISYKLFRQLRAVVERTAVIKDEDDEKSPEEYCRAVQAQFQKVMEGTYVQKIEFFLFGALSAYKNGHYREAWCFVSQAPVMVVTAESSAQAEQDHILIYLEILKMIEIKLLTKIGQPEQAIIQAQGHYFSVAALQVISHNWCLVASLKYQLKLALFKIAHFNYKKHTMESKRTGGAQAASDASFDEDVGLVQYQLQKAEDDFWNLMANLCEYSRSSDLSAFRRLAVKMLGKAEHNHDIAKMLLRTKGQWLAGAEQTPESATGSISDFEDFFKAVEDGGHDEEQKDLAPAGEKPAADGTRHSNPFSDPPMLANSAQSPGAQGACTLNPSQPLPHSTLLSLTMQHQRYFYSVLAIMAQSLAAAHRQVRAQFLDIVDQRKQQRVLRIEKHFKTQLWAKSERLVELASILQVLLNSVPLIVYRDTASSHYVKANLHGDIIYKNKKYEEFNQFFDGEVDQSKSARLSYKTDNSASGPVAPCRRSPNQCIIPALASACNPLPKGEVNQTGSAFPLDDSSSWQFEGGAEDSIVDDSAPAQPQQNPEEAGTAERGTLVRRIQQQTDNRELAKSKVSKVLDNSRIVDRSPISGHGRRPSFFQAMKIDYFNQKLDREGGAHESRKSIDFQRVQIFKRFEYLRSQSNIAPGPRSRDMAKGQSSRQRSSFKSPICPRRLERNGNQRGLSPLVAPRLQKSAVYDNCFRPQDQNENQKEEIKPSFGSLVAQQTLENKRKRAPIESPGVSREVPPFSNVVKKQWLARLAYNNEEHLEDDVRHLLALQDEASHQALSEDLASEEMENLSIEMLLEGEEDRRHHELLGHSLCSPVAMFNLCLACLVTDTNHAVALTICRILKKQINKQSEAFGTSIPANWSLGTIELLMAFACLRLHELQPPPVSSAHGQQVPEEDQAQERPETKNDDDSSSTASFERKQWCPGFLLKQSLLHFRRFNADESLPGQPHLVLWIYLYTQKMLISKHKLLPKRFRKPITILEQEDASITPSFSMEPSQYQAHAAAQSADGAP